MDTIKDRIEYLSVRRARTLPELEKELGLHRGALEHCDQIPLAPEDLEKVAKFLNVPSEQLNGAPPEPFVPSKRW